MEIPYTVTARPDTGLWNAKVGIWLFLASEVMLFGGLFSSYVFLRLGADYPWPHGELQVPFGFVNTLILILSSVFVVYAWVALKMRQWNRYRLWMFLVVLCAAIFLVNKGFEYKAKFTHYHVTLKDGSIVAGHVDSKDDKSLIFDASHVVLDSASGSHYFLKWLENKDDVRFTLADGTEVEPSRAWVADIKKGLELQAEADSLAAEEDSEGAAKLQAEVDENYPALETINDIGQLRLALSPNGHFVLPRNKVLSWTDEELNLTRAHVTKLEGELVSASLKMHIDELDLRVYLRHDDPRQRAVADAAIFSYFDDQEEGEQLLEDFNHYRDPKLAEQREAVAEWKSRHPDAKYEEKPFYDFERVKLDKLHDALHEASHDSEDGGGEGEGDHEQHAATGGDGEAGGHAHPAVTIPFEDVKFFSNFGPRKNTFYAIYFTMTGLHGLHVFGGMLVLGYFLVRGRKLYLKNPEHMANRVEVGGLFWHFVDLVWIFLFPIFYLM